MIPRIFVFLFHTVIGAEGSVCRLPSLKYVSILAIFFYSAIHIQTMSNFLSFFSYNVEFNLCNCTNN